MLTIRTLSKAIQPRNATALFCSARDPLASGSTVHGSCADSASVREKLLRRALDHVPYLGWTDSAVHAACDDFGLSRAAAAIVIEGEDELSFPFSPNFPVSPLSSKANGGGQSNPSGSISSNSSGSMSMLTSMSPFSHRLHAMNRSEFSSSAIGSELAHFFTEDCNRRLSEQLLLLHDDISNNNNNNNGNGNGNGNGNNNNKKKNKNKKEGDKVSLPVHKVVKVGLRTRLEMVAPFRDNWAQGIAAMADGAGNTQRALRNLAELVDDIWWHAGDRSTDLNWYTKRAITSAIYVSSEMVMIQDESPDLEETWEFLDRRIEDAKDFAESKDRIADDINLLTSGLQSLVSSRQFKI